MADDSDPTTTAAPVPRAVIVVFAFVAMLLAAGIAVLAIMQVGSAGAAQSAATGAQLARQDTLRLRQDAEAKELKLADLAAKIQAEAATVAAGLKALEAADARIQEGIAAAVGQQGRQAELSSVVQQEMADKLARLTERLEELRTEVVLKETKTLQGQITDSKGRLDQTENEVLALRRAFEDALKEADVPSLKAKVQSVDRELLQTQADLKALAKASDAFKAEVAKAFEASEAFKAQVTEFFQHVLYNDPWGRYTPGVPALPAP